MSVIISQNRIKALVTRWGEDPVDIWRRDAEARFTGPARSWQTHALAEEVTAIIIDILASRGHEAEPTSHKCPFDLLLASGVAVEVKAANWTDRQVGKRVYGRYQAKIPRRQPQAAHVVIVACRAPTGWRFFIIPSGEITTRQVTITSRDPEAYAGKWSAYLDRWDLVESVWPEDRQPRLF